MVVIYEVYTIKFLLLKIFCMFLKHLLTYLLVFNNITHIIVNNSFEHIYIYYYKYKVSNHLILYNNTIFTINCNSPLYIFI